MQANLEVIQNQIGYKFQNVDLLYQAFTRKSYSQENGGADNEILEFIGDKVLDIVVMKYLMGQYGYLAHESDDFYPDEEDKYYSDLTEGELTELKKRLVQKKTLAHRIDVLNWEKYLIMGKGDQIKGINEMDSVKEDLFEAVIGAITIDCEWDFSVLTDIVVMMLEPDSEMENADTYNYVNIIEEWHYKRYGEYACILCENSSYYDEHSMMHSASEIRTAPCNNSDFIIDVNRYEQTHFKCSLIIQEIGKVFIGYGESKASARYNLCRLVYENIEKYGLINTIRDEIENPSRDMAVNQLEILARRGYFSIPTYEYSGNYDSEGNSVWKCICRIAEESRITSAISSSKKSAKKDAAYAMLRNVLDL